MTITEAKRIEKQLQRAWTLAAKSRRAFKVLSVIEESLTAVRAEQRLEHCPSCREILHSWHDHKPGCKSA